MKNQTYIACYKKKATDTDGYLFLQSKGRKNRRKKALGIKVVYDKFNSYWNDKEQRFMSGMPQYKLLNEKIARAFDEYIKETGEIVEVTKGSKQSFLKYWDSIIQLIPNQGSKGKHVVVKKKLEKYLQTIRKTDIDFADITPEFIKKVHYYFQTAKDPERLSTNSVNSYMKLINNIIRRKIKDAPYTFAINPFATITLEKKKQAKRKVLSERELNSLLTKKIEDSELDFVRDMYVFQIFASGMRISDLCLLRWRNIKTFLAPKTEGEWFDIETGLPSKAPETIVLIDKDYVEPELNYVMFKTRTEVNTPLTYYTCKALLKLIGAIVFFNSYSQSKFICIYRGEQKSLWELEMDLEDLPVNDKNLHKRKELIDLITVSKQRMISSLISEAAQKISNYVAEKNCADNFVFPILVNKDFQSISHDDDAFKDAVSKSEELKHKLLYGAKIYRRKLDKIGELCSIEDIMPHAARHTFTQLMINAGASTHNIMGELGHTTLNVTDSYMRHKKFKNKQGENFLDKIGNKIDYLE